MKTLWQIIWSLNGYERPAVDLLDSIGGFQLDRTHVVSTDRAKLEQTVEKLVTTSALDEHYEIREKETS